MLPILHKLLPDVRIQYVLHNATILDLYKFAYLHLNTSTKQHRTCSKLHLYKYYIRVRGISSLLGANPRVVLLVLSAVHDGGGAASFDRSSFLFSMEGPRGKKLPFLLIGVPFTSSRSAIRMLLHKIAPI
jgi:hypothetical protein